MKALASLLLILTLASGSKPEARSLQKDIVHHRILMGDSKGILYQSSDGLHWAPLVEFSKHYIIDSIVVNNDIITLGVWDADNPYSGSILWSNDAGKTWVTIDSMDGIAIKSLDIGPDGQIVAGTLSGVYKTTDKLGISWKRISLPDMINVQSVAIDPFDQLVIYAGSWHLGWMTYNGGATWKLIYKGVANDSDLFSITFDPANDSIIWLGACSGIYQGTDDGLTFHKISRIPNRARRTHVIRFIGKDVYAGTTDGLWVSHNHGKNWQRLGSSDIVVDDVLQYGSSIIIATENYGILIYPE